MTDVVEPKLTLVSGVAAQWEGGAGIIIINGIIGGATVDLSFSDDAVNYIAIGSQFSVTGYQVFAAPRNSWLKAVVTGGAPTLTIKAYREAGLHAWVQNPSSASGGPSSDVNIASFGGAAISKGQKVMAQSMPVVLASDYSVSTSAADMSEIVGTIGSAAVLSNFPFTTTAYHRAAIQFTTVTAGNTSVVEESNDNSTWTTLTSIGGAATVTAAGMHVYNFSGKYFRVRCSVWSSGSVTVTAEFRAYPLPFPAAFGAGAVDTRTQRHTLASDDPAVTSLTSILTKLNASIAVTGTFWQTTQPVSRVPVGVTPTDKGSTITLGGTAQTLAALNASRKGLVIQNPANATEDLFISVTGNATVNGAGNYASLGPGASCNVAFEGMVITAAVTVIAATTGHRFLATEVQ